MDYSSGLTSSKEKLAVKLVSFGRKAKTVKSITYKRKSELTLTRGIAAQIYTQIYI